MPIDYSGAPDSVTINPNNLASCSGSSGISSS